jgi:hypothetical protein
MTGPLNPDCRDGKHATCHGDAWDVERDEECPCGCPCHEGGNVAVLPDALADRAA